MRTFTGRLIRVSPGFLMPVDESGVNQGGRKIFQLGKGKDG